MSEGNAGDAGTGAGAGAGTGGGAASAGDLIGGAAGDAGAGGVAAGGAAGAGDAGAGAAAGGEDAASEEFLQRFSAEPGEAESPSNRDWIKSKGFKEIDGIIKSYRETEKALKDSGRVKIPGEGASAEEVTLFRKAMGVPDDAKGYAPPPLTDAEGKPLLGQDGQPLEIDHARFDALAGYALEAGMPKAAFEAVMAKVAQLDLQQAAEAERDIQRRAEAHAKKWGSELAEKTAAVGRALDALGLTREEGLAIRAVITPERALDIFAKLGSGIGEDTMLTGGGRQRFGISGAEAQKQLDQRRASKEWRDKAMIPGSAENAEYNRLNEAIGADAERRAREAA